MSNHIAVNIGEQRFDKLIEEHKFYIDKTGFIKEWWFCFSRERMFDWRR